MSLPVQSIQTLIQSLLNGQYAPTGIGTNPPAQLGPDPNRTPTAGLPNFRPGQSNLDIMSLLAPYFALLSSGVSAPGGTTSPATNPLAAPGSSAPSAPGSDLLTQILTQLQSPASPWNPTYQPAGGAAGPASPLQMPTFGPQFEQGGNAGNIEGSSSGHEVLR